MVRYSEVISALSFVLDMVEGQSQGHIIRTCFIGMTVARRLGLSDERRSALFHALQKICPRRSHAWSPGIRP